MRQAALELQTLPGVSKHIAEQLVDMGYTNKNLVATLSVSELMKLDGVGKIRAGMILAGTEWEIPKRRFSEMAVLASPEIDIVVEREIEVQPKKVGRVTSDGKLDKDELMILAEVYANNRDGGTRGWTN